MVTGRRAARQGRYHPTVGATETFRFPILFTGANRTMSWIGIRRSKCAVELSDGRISVRFSWAFHADLSRASLAGVGRDHHKVGGWGVHGWRGAWLVNGSAHGLVRMTFDPPGRGRLLGFPVTVRRLRVSLEEPEAFLAALGAPAAE